MKCVIYDFETLSLDPATGVALSLAALPFNTTNFPYSLKALLEKTFTIKFDVLQQVAMGRTVCPETLNWWQLRTEAKAQEVLVPRKDDRPVADIPQWWNSRYLNTGTEWFITRRATLDKLLLKSLCGNLPYEWWRHRELVSIMSGLTMDSRFDDKFEPAGSVYLVPHVPAHDIVRDVLRLQELMGGRQPWTEEEEQS